MGHGNQSGNFWQEEICASYRTTVPYEFVPVRSKLLMNTLVICTL
jgi:hypothetical protein